METESKLDIGIVTAVQNGRISVVLDNTSGCNSCGMRRLCGKRDTPTHLFFETSEVYQVGDKVIVTMSEGIRILSSLIVFVLPLVILFGTYIVARLFCKEQYSILIGFGSMIVTFLLIKIIDKKIGKKIRFELGNRYEDLS